MKSEREQGLFNWRLTHRMKFLRTAWLIPFTLAALIFLFLSNDVSLSLKTSVTSILLVTLCGQLAYYYYKWQEVAELKE